VCVSRPHGADDRVERAAHRDHRGRRRLRTRLRPSGTTPPTILKRLFILSLTITTPVPDHHAGPLCALEEAFVSICVTISSFSVVYVLCLSA
jgi:hypothetical protein